MMKRNIIRREYKATCGYHDYPPGQDELYLLQKVTNGKVTLDFHPIGNFFNEVQVEGDPELRREKLTGSESEILFIDDPNYEKLKLRRTHWSTRNLPLTLSDEFVKAWALMSSYPASLIAKSNEIEYIGDVNYRMVLPHIKNIHWKTRERLANIKDDVEFIAEFVKVRDELNEEFEYNE